MTSGIPSRMILHRFALNEDGILVDIEAFTRETRPAGWVFLCPGCQGVMCARIGEIKDPHFAHQDSHALCAEEKYFIGLAANAMIKGFNAAKANGKPYSLKFHRQGTCTRPQAIGLSSCVYSSPDSRDLTRYWDFCKSVSDGQVGDLVIGRRDKKHSLYVSLWVTRRGREELPVNGDRWVELRITDEASAFRLADGLDLTGPDARSVGLDFAKYILGDCDGRCRCARKVRCLTVFRSGKIRGADLPMHEAIKATGEVAAGGLLVDENFSLKMSSWVAWAASEILDRCSAIKNCQICSRRTVDDGHLACSKRHAPANWNDAGTCPDFERYGSTAEAKAHDEVLCQEDRAKRHVESAMPLFNNDEERLYERLKYSVNLSESICLFGMPLDESLRYAQTVAVEGVLALSEDLQRRIVGCWGYSGVVISDLPFSLVDYYEKGAIIGRSEHLSGK